VHSTTILLDLNFGCGFSWQQIPSVETVELPRQNNEHHDR